MKTSGWVVVTNAVAALIAQAALAAGQLELQSTSYLRSSPDRFTNGGGFVLRYQKDSKKGWYETRMNLSLNGYSTDAQSLTPEARDLYVSTSQEFSQLHRLTLGRRTSAWSRADDFWALGAWSPRFNWDPLRPIHVGLTGFTYEYRSRLLGIRAFASPVIIPERGAPLRVEEGRLVSSNPDAAVPFESVSVLNQNVPIQYRLEMPDASKLVLNSSFIAQAVFGEREGGFWSSFTAGVKPMNAVDVSAQAAMKLQPTPFIDAALFPRMVQHRLATFEAGWESDGFDAWASVSREQPVDAGLSPGLTGSPMGPATLSAWGLAWHNERGSRFEVGGLNIQEAVTAAAEGDVQISLPSRYRFKQALRSSLAWQAHERLDYSTSWVKDFGGGGDWISIQARYAFARSRWQLGAGADFFFNTAGSAGLFSPYGGNDRFQGRLTYAF
jgi:hypothetical protein